MSKNIFNYFSFDKFFKFVFDDIELKRIKCEDLVNLLKQNQCLQNKFNLDKLQNSTVSSRILKKKEDILGFYSIDFPNDKANQLIVKHLELFESEKFDHLYRLFIFDHILKRSIENKIEILVLDFDESGQKFFVDNFHVFDLPYEIKVAKMTNNSIQFLNENNKRKLSTTSDDILVFKPKKKRITEVTLKRVYINAIQRKEKTIEGRINSGMFKNINKGDKIRFFYFQNQNDDVLCEIKDKRIYKSFEEFLKMEDFKKCIPDANSYESALKIYNSIPGYYEKAKANGVIAFELQVVSN